MKKSLKSVSVMGFGLAYLLISVLAPAIAYSATPNSIGGAGAGQALEIAPPLISISANPGQTIKTSIKLRDITNSNLIVSNEVNDFVASGEDGTPKILTGNDANNPFSMKDWVQPLPSFTLSPQKVQDLSVTIYVPASASPGGHYAVIRFTGTPPSLNGTGVSLSASLGTLVLLTVSGKLNHNMSVQEFSANKDGKKGNVFQSSPVDFTVRLKNSGNVQEEPTGHIAINDMFGKNIANVNVNIPPRNVLPDSIRKFSSELGSSTIGNKRLFGRYHATLKMNYGDNYSQVTTASLTFWVIPWKMIAIVVGALIVLFFVLRFGIRRYNERIIRSHSGHRR